MPTESDAGLYRQAIAGSDLTPLPLDLTNERAAPSAMETASLLYHAEKIDGMCDSDKTRALIEIFRAMPRGDVVEIGSWWGKVRLPPASAVAAARHRPIAVHRSIAALHIDGNHAYEHAGADIVGWTKLVMPGAGS